MPEFKLNDREILTVLRVLCTGYDPDTGLTLSEGCIPRSETVLTALSYAASALEKLNIGVKLSNNFNLEDI